MLVKKSPKSNSEDSLMSDLFSQNGKVNKVFTFIYHILWANTLWLIFSIPLVTIGASTTALFYIMEKVARDEDVDMFPDFKKSFKDNFKQSTLVWCIIFIIFLLVFMDIRNVHVYGAVSNIIHWILIFILLQLAIITTYIFPIISRYEIKTKQLFFASFIIGNKHIPSTILCLGTFVGLMFLGSKLPGLVLFTFWGIYGFLFSLMFERICYKYFPKPKKEDDNGDDVLE
jgi:uncharacterized membrane protein YesL